MINLFKVILILSFLSSCQTQEERQEERIEHNVKKAEAREKKESRERTQMGPNESSLTQ